MRPIVKNWLEPFNPKIHMYTTLSMDDEPDAELLAFKNDVSDSMRLLFCVERLNEGLHLSDLDGIFMLRPTQSPIIYLQQMGRSLNTGTTKQPVIFDLVNNFSEYKRTVLRYRDMSEEEIENLSPKARAEYNSYKEEKYDEFFEFDFVQELSSICDKFEELDELYAYKYHKKCARYDPKMLMDKILEYYNKYQKWPSRPTNYQGLPIGNYYYRLKYLYSKGLLDKELEKELLFHGIELDRVLPDIEENWYFHYKLLREFVEIHNRLPKLREVYKGIQLGYWVKCQKRSYKKGILSKEKIKLLEDLGVNFHSGLKEQWINNFKIFSDYYKKFGVIPSITKKYKNTNVGNWFRNQLIKYGQGKLDADQVNMFINLGINLDLLYKEYIKKRSKISRKSLKRENDWMKKFELLKKFMSLNSREPTGNEVFENVNLGAWLYHQKKLYKEKRLRKDRQEKLEAIGVVFDEEKKKNKE